MERLTIAIQPELEGAVGPEVWWTWRQILTTIGLPWEEVAFGQGAADVVYAAEGVRASHRLLRVMARPDRWQRRSGLALARVGQEDDWQFPLFEGEGSQGRGFVPADGALTCGRDLVFDFFWLATGQEEARWPRNRHGWLSLEGTAWQREEALRLALASAAVCRLERALRDAGAPAPVPRWPGGKAAAASITHDVDYPEVVRLLEPLRVLLRRGPRGVSAALALATGRRHHWHFPALVQFAEALGARSAFYFAARKGSLWQYATGTPDPFYDVRAKRFRELLSFLGGHGIEIGLHASYHAFESAERMAGEKRRLDEACGSESVGNRHHYLHLDPEDAEGTLRMHEQVGFAYDSSLAHERYVGWRRGLCSPYFPFDQEERRELRTLQLPLAWVDIQFSLHGKDNPGDPDAIGRALADRAVALGGHFLVDCHDCYFDKVLYPGMWDRFARLCREIAGRADVWLDTPARVAAHWASRSAALRAASQGLGL